MKADASKASSTRVTTRRQITPMLSFIGVSFTFLALFLAAGAPSPLFELEQMKWGFPVWVLTVAFAIYAVALLAALLVAGSLSDHIGRRPVLVAALAGEVVSMVLFLVSPNIAWVIAARVVQGIATGAAAGAFTAAIVEYAPEGNKKLGALIGSAAPAAGLGLGALLAGLAVQFSENPGPVIFGSLIVLFILGIVIVVLSPETVTPKPGVRRALIPRVSVPGRARKEFAAAIPVNIASWMQGGFYLGLVPLLLVQVFGADDGVVSGLAIFALSGVGAASGLIFGPVAPRVVILVGGALIVVGALIVLLSISMTSLPVFFIGTVVAGIGFGLNFSGALRIITPLAEPHQRAELFAGVYVVSYLAFSLPVIVAGVLVGFAGLTSVAMTYILVMVAAALAGIIAQGALARRTATAA